MSLIFSRLNAAASKKRSAMHGSQKTMRPLVHSNDLCTASAFEESLVSIPNSVVGERSTTVCHTKEDYEKLSLIKTTSAETSSACATDEDLKVIYGIPDPEPKILRKIERKYRKLQCQMELRQFMFQEYMMETILEEQAGVLESKMDEVKSILAKMSAVRNVTIPNGLMYQVERLVSLYFGLSRCDDMKQGVAIVHLYLSQFYERSIVTMVMDALKGFSMENQAGDSPTWLSLLKLAQTNWKLVIANEGFSHLGNVLSMMLTLGLCDSADIDFTIAGMKMFSVRALKKQVTAIDLIDAIFSTVAFFIEGGYECFKQGSVKPLLYGDLDMQKLEDQIALCEQYAEYAKTGDLEKRVNLSNNDFEAMLISVIEKMETLIKTSKNVVAIKLLRDKLDKIRKIQTYFRQTRVQGGLREAPYGMGFYGGSGVGKSSVSNIMMIAVLMHNGFNASDEALITLNEGDKYMSNMRSYINGIFIDDIGNVKAEFVEKAPTAKIIELINNVRAYANMAEADMKGKVSLEPKVVVTTKNVKNMCAETYSNEPASITRREQFVATVKVRKEFATKDMLDSDKVSKHFGEKIPLIPDLWEFTIEKSFPVPNPVEGKPAVVGWEIVNFNGRKMNGVSIYDLIEFACVTSKKYFANQAQLVANSNNLADKMEFCGECKFPGCMCKCARECQNKDKNDSEDQAGMLLAPFVWTTFAKYRKKTLSLFDQYMQKLEEKTLEEMMTRLQWLENSPYACWTNYVPTQYLNSEHFMQALLWYNQDELKEKIRQSTSASYGLIFLILFISLFSSWWFLLALVFPLYSLCIVIETEKARLYAKVCEDNAAMPEIFKKHRDAYVEYITGACLALSLLYLLVQTYRLVKILPSSQGNLAPTSINDIVERDTESNIEEQDAKDFGWTGYLPDAIPASEKSKTARADHLRELVKKNLGRFTYEKDAKTYGCDIFFIESNLALLPNHIWKMDEIQATVEMSEKRISHGMRFSKTHSVPIPGHDLTLVYVPGAGDWKDLTDYLPVSELRRAPGHFQYKHFENGKMRMLESDVMLNFGQVANTSKSFYGAKYDLSFNTFVGLCMGVITLESANSYIAGFHLGGLSKTPKGIAGTVLRSEYDRARWELEQIPGVTLAASRGTMKTELYGVQFFEGSAIHPKSPVHKLDADAQLEVYGSCKGRSTMKSEVVRTPICEIVEDVCGVECSYGQPKFYLGDAFEQSLKVSSKPSAGVEAKFLKKAVEDYVKDLISDFTTIPELAEYVRPLSDMENLCGIDGLRFIDKLKPQTAVGYPLVGKKEKFIEPLNPDDFPGQACPVKLDDMFWQEVARMEKEYLAGRRCHVPFKACLKDEPTKLTKDKVRVFQAAPIALQLCVRKYFLPLVRLFSLFPLTSECGVGIGVKGPEFSALIEHMRKFGDDRILAGDYSKYDLRMPAQLTLAAFDVLIQIAIHYGYSDDDIKIMRGIATDICYPVMAYNGDLLQHFGSNPSGQNLTVYINSIVNALLFRSAYYCIYKGRTVPPFRKVVSLMTLGDDAKGSVKRGYDEMNHISYANFLRERDIVFTMPDKESTPTEFMKDSEADFLKLSNRYDPDLKRWVGALSEDSIFKSLFTVLKSKAVSLNEQSMMNIDGALREWFYYGREIYEMRREQMREVASRAKISHGCTMLDKTFDECVAEYKAKYHLE